MEEELAFQFCMHGYYITHRTVLPKIYNAVMQMYQMKLKFIASSELHIPEVVA